MWCDVFAELFSLLGDKLPQQMDILFDVTTMSSLFNNTNNKQCIGSLRMENAVVCMYMHPCMREARLSNGLFSCSHD
jgi:hypothetical protein